MAERSAVSPSLVRVAALVLPLVTCAILSAFRDSVTSATAALILVVWVVAASATGDRLAGIIAALSGGAWFDFFLTQPYHRFAIEDSEDVEVTVLLILIGAAVGEIALWGRRQQARAARRSGYLDGVLSTARLVSLGDLEPSALIDMAAQQIKEVLGATGCRFVAGPAYDTRYAILDQNGQVTRGGRPVAVQRHGLPVDEEVAIVVRRGPEILGHFLVTAASSVAYPSAEQLRVAVLLADQLAPVLRSS